MTGAAKYSIGPLTTYADPAELEKLFREAAPRVEFVYAIGPALGRGAPTALTAARLAAGGGGTLVQKRDGKVIKYIIRKRELPPGNGAALAPELDPTSLCVLQVIAAQAEAGLPCPSYAELAELADLPTRRSAQYRFELLLSRGLVTIKVVDGVRVARVAS